MGKMRGLGGLLDVMPRHDIGGALCSALECLEDLVDINVEKVWLQRLAVDALRLHLDRRGRWCSGSNGMLNEVLLLNQQEWCCRHG